MKLYHFTCRHGRLGIIRDGIIRPWPQRFTAWVHSLAWFTTLAVPTREALGLTDPCDKTEFRYVIQDTALIVPWVDYRAQLHPLAVELAELPGSIPDTWYVSEYPIDIELYARSKTGSGR